MAFIIDEETGSTLDPEKGLELDSRGSHSGNTYLFCKVGEARTLISEGRTYLGGGICAKRIQRVRTDADKEHFPNADWPISGYCVEKPYLGMGPFEVKGFNKKETMDMMREALLVHMEHSRRKRNLSSYRDIWLTKNMEQYINESWG